MADFPAPSDIKELVSLIAPGLIILTIRARVLVGPEPDILDRLISYAIVSTAYYAVISPIFYVSSGITLSGWAWLATQYFLLPVAIGIILAQASALDFEQRVAEKIRLSLSHQIPASWDYKFSRLPSGTFVLVTLNDGSQVPGLVGRRSFASSSREERDLLIEEVWEIDSSGQWTMLQPARSILLFVREIKFIEFFDGANYEL